MLAVRILAQSGTSNASIPFETPPNSLKGKGECWPLDFSSKLRPRSSLNSLGTPSGTPSRSADSSRAASAHAEPTQPRSKTRKGPHRPPFSPLRKGKCSRFFSQSSDGLELGSYSPVSLRTPSAGSGTPVDLLSPYTPVFCPGKSGGFEG